MKAAVLYGKNDLRYEEIAAPMIGSDEVLVKMKAAGICGSDMPRVMKGSSHFFPNILGHEFSGEVVEIGSDVTTVKVGDSVSGAPLKPCHKCDDCLQGNYAQCKNYSFIGSREFGSWAEYLKMPEINVVKLPDGCSWVDGALMEPVTVGLHGIFLMDFKPGYDTAIIGTGTIGLLTMQCAKLLGARRIFAFDIDDDRLAVAKEYGADYVFNTMDNNMMDELNKVTNGKGIKMVIETAGVPAAEIMALAIAGNKASVMYIGTPHSPLTLQPEEFEMMNRKELTIRGSWMSYSSPYPGREWELAAEYLSKGLIKTEKLIDRIIPLCEAASAFEDLAVPGKVKGKIILEG